MYKKSSINIDILLGEDKVPENISWKATDSSAEGLQRANAMILSFWDNADKSTLRIDLWTRNMNLDEMTGFYYQVFLGMADTYHRATKDVEMREEIRKFALEFLKKYRAKQEVASPEVKKQ
ncbi:MAG: gliding motility protein GldC [Chitinophagaceae bacterium]|nr:MAG: gliding motility protein GldC [Chitinophagaceae bacterium]